MSGAGAERPAVLLGDEREVEQRRTPAAGVLRDRHGDRAHLLERGPTALVEAERLGVAHALGRRFLGVQRGERLDQLLLLVTRSKFHASRSGGCVVLATARLSFGKRPCQCAAFWPAAGA